MLQVRELGDSRWLPVVRRLVERSSELRAHREPLAELNVVFMDDRTIADINWRFLRHRGPTDVITFGYGEGRGEILVSVDTARRAARKYRQTAARELTLYIAHGILHLSGLDDRTPAQRRKMRAAERDLLSPLPKPLNT